MTAPPGAGSVVIHYNSVHKQHLTVKVQSYTIYANETLVGWLSKV